MISWLLWNAFGFCRHLRRSFPMTDPKTRVITVSCLDCARRFRYNWREMRLDD